MPHFFAILPVFLAGLGLFFFTSPLQASTPAAGPTMVDLSELPKWKGDPRTLIWIEAKAPNELAVNMQGPRAPGPVKTRMQGLEIADLQHGYTRYLPLPRRWKIFFDESNSRCPRMRFVFDNPKYSAFYELMIVKDSVPRYKGSGCSSSTGIYDITALNDRYLALTTSTPGFIFFDMETGTTLPTIVTYDPWVEDFVLIYTDEKGDILLGRDISDLRIVTLPGHSLRYKTSQGLLQDVNKLNTKRRCEVEYEHGRDCAEW